MTDSLKGVSTRSTTSTSTPQSQKAVKGEKRNNAGGFVFTITDFERAKRFLILGSEGNMYVPGAKLSKDNSKVLIKIAESADSLKLIDYIAEVSSEGRAPRQNPALFALAVSSSFGSQESKAYALSKLPEVARTGTALFLFAGYVEQFRGWGPALRRAIANWYLSKPVDKAAYQAVKYQNREGYSHRDLFRLSHPVSSDAAFKGLGEWVLRGNSTEAPAIIKAFVEAQQASPARVVELIREYNLSWEMLPTERLNDVDVWKALLPGLGLGALIRQLPRLTKLDLLKPLSAELALAVSKITDPEQIKRARMHPLNILIAQKTYASGRSERGTSTWTPVQQVVDALDKAFYLAFKTVVPSGKRTLLALDVSGSMGSTFGDSTLTSRDATAAMSLVTMATEPYTHIIGFTGGRGGYGYGRRAVSAGTGEYSSMVTELKISPSMRLSEAVNEIAGLPFGSTDCSLPMLYAMEKGLEVDTFVVYTDNETWAGRVHPFEALKQYRAKTGIPAKLIVMSTEATKFSIADPSDAGMLDIPGFDSAAPALIAEFSKGL